MRVTCGRPSDASRFTDKVAVMVSRPIQAWSAQQQQQQQEAVTMSGKLLIITVGLSGECIDDDDDDNDGDNEICVV